jgi:hypothetical protein
VAGPGGRGGGGGGEGAAKEGDEGGPRGGGGAGARGQGAGCRPRGSSRAEGRDGGDRPRKGEARGGGKSGPHLWFEWVGEALARIGVEGVCRRERYRSSGPISGTGSTTLKWGSVEEAAASSASGCCVRGKCKSFVRPVRDLFAHIQRLSPSLPRLLPPPPAGPSSCTASASDRRVCGRVAPSRSPPLRFPAFLPANSTKTRVPARACSTPPLWAALAYPACGCPSQPPRCSV